MATKQFREFDAWLSKETCPLRRYPNMNHREVCIAEDTWKAALEWIYYAGVLTDLPKDLIDEELGNEI